MREIKRDKLGHFLKGHKETRGENNAQWKGEEAGYGSIHDWVKLRLGKPNYCQHCKATDKKKYEWANISKKYKRDLNDWIRLCVSCHDEYDDCRAKMWQTRRASL